MFFPIILTELSDRIDQLQKECPAEWSPEREAIEGKVQELQRGWDEAGKTFRNVTVQPHSLSPFPFDLK